MHGALRIIIAIGSTLIFVGGLIAVFVGGGAAIPGIQAVIIGGVGILAVTLERSRYRSEQAERVKTPAGPGGGEDSPLEARFQRTDEAFIDPTSARQMRVWLDPRTGERRYRAEG
jgi:hypothetical protein